MDLDVTAICKMNLELIVDEMEEAASIEALDEAYEDAKTCLEALHNALKVVKEG